MDDCPPSRQIEEAILTHPVVKDVEQKSGPRSFDAMGRSIDLLIRPFNRSVSELALGGNAGGVRPRANSLQDDRRLKSPSGNPPSEDPIIVRSLPIPDITPPSFGGLGSGKLLNVEAPPFIPPPGLKTPPTKASEDTTTTVSPPAPDPSPTVGLVEEPRSPSLYPEERDSTSLASSVSSTTSTVKPVVSVITAAKSGPPTKQRFSKAERRAVETVINILLEMRSKGETHVSPGILPPLILARDRTIYRGVGSRANRFWKLIDLGVQMGWLEAGPEKAWIDVGKGWTEEVTP
ncbi:hypothetical protein BDM02DRAFT_2240744 [Thelephora ganbajun]|uniref:Uncharacterized protein n=1 Tax=Thelephora ganbajun TaxID=370292 RepID=A0ACB6ZGD3_THEGA|nr:hypothetical protein BDM02DRAFT_2240744 [Thelephora ganbajun]